MADVPSDWANDAGFGLDALKFGSALVAARYAEGAASIANQLNQNQLAYAARVQQQQRFAQYLHIRGAQQAAEGAMGITGGRSARAIDLQTRLDYERAQGAADIQTLTRSQQAQNRFQEETTGSWLQIANAGVSLFSAGLEASKKARVPPPGGAAQPASIPQYDPQFGG